MSDANVTDRQRKWFASVRAGLERDTGKSLAEWVAIARDCPPGGQRQRLQWFKETHGLLQNRAMWVLEQADGGGAGWDDPQALTDALWGDPGARSILEALDQAMAGVPGTVRTVRRGYTAWSRRVQFAAARPLKSGGAMLGLAVPPEVSALLSAPRRESWSERLKSCVPLAAAADITPALKTLIDAAADRS